MDSIAGPPPLATPQASSAATHRPGQWAWIHSPAVDLLFFTLTWLIPLGAYLTLAFWGEEPVCDVGVFPSCTQGAMLLYLLGDWALQIHRHYTIALTYGDRSHWVRHRKIFVGAPAVLAAVIVPLALYRFYPVRWQYHVYVVLMVVAIPLFLWNLPHIIMQKYGLIRIYAVRLGYGDPKVEKDLVLWWMYTIGAWAVLRYGAPSIDGLTGHFHIDVHWVSPVIRVASLIFYPTAAWALWKTWLWIRDEARHYHPRNIPKLLYVASVACILLTGFYSAVVCFTVIAISHSVEYVAFLSVYAQQRQPLRSWIRSPLLLNLVCLPGTLVFLLSLYFGAPEYFFAYAVFQAYTHNFFDTYIWRVREAPIREAVLAIGRPVAAGQV